MRKAFILQAAAAWALQADDQTTLSDPLQNPVEPSQEFLLHLQAPSTLLVTHPDANFTELSRLLTESGHRVTTATSSETTSVFKDGRWLYDTIILVGNVLPRSSELGGGLTGRRVVDFFDEEWRLPPPSGVYGEKGLFLPPSVMIFNDPCQIGEGCERVCSPDRTMRLVAEQFGIGLGVDHLKYVSPECNHKVANPHFHGSSHLLEVDNNFTHSFYHISHRDDLLDATRKRSVVSLISGSRNWSRGVWVNSESMCDDSMIQQNRHDCLRLLDWLTHRTDVLTWSNWQHYKIGGSREWVEYGDDVEREAWSLSDLRDGLDLSRPYLYRIRDEILVAIDLWSVERVGSKFRWVPNEEPAVEMEYTMMVPWIRKLLVPFKTDVKRQPTRLMDAIARNHEQLKQLPLKLRSATSWIHFKAPKQHGIFKLVIRSIGGSMPRTPIWIESVMPLRTYKHDEDPRFVPSGYPYYISLISSTVMFWFLCLLFLYLPSSRAASSKKIE